MVVAVALLCGVVVVVVAVVVRDGEPILSGFSQQARGDRGRLVRAVHGNFERGPGQTRRECQHRVPLGRDRSLRRAAQVRHGRNRNRMFSRLLDLDVCVCVCVM